MLSNFGGKKRRVKCIAKATSEQVLKSILEMQFIYFDFIHWLFFLSIFVVNLANFILIFFFFKYIIIKI